jgi:predicted helicase
LNFWRTANGPEVDLVIEQAGGKAMAIECKFKEHPGKADAAGLSALAESEKGGIRKKVIVCRTKVTYKLSDDTLVVNTSELLKNNF